MRLSPKWMLATAVAATMVSSIPAAAAAAAETRVRIDSSGCPVVGQFGPGEPDLAAVTADSRLVTVNRRFPSIQRTSVPVTGVEGSIVGMDVRPATGQTYLVTNSGGTGRLYTVDVSTGVATLAAPISTPLAGTRFGVDFNPVPDRLRVVSDANQNLRINPDTGAATVDGALAFAAGDANAGADPAATAAAYTNSVPPSPRMPDPANPATGTTLYDIDTDRDVLVVQNPPNNGTLNTVGPLRFDVTGVNGFDIDGRNGNEATAALQLRGAPVSLLFRIDLATGDATPVGPVGCGSTVVGLAYRVV